MVTRENFISSSLKIAGPHKINKIKALKHDAGMLLTSKKKINKKRQIKGLMLLKSSDFLPSVLNLSFSCFFHMLTATNTMLSQVSSIHVIVMNSLLFPRIKITQ